MGPSPWKTGSIVRVTMHQFMTYQDVVVNPGSRLNLVMGPNGSGKSTIMCAIALGLGAAPKVLGRADNVGEFIMNGMDEGYVEVELFNESDRVNGGRNYVVRRDFQRSTRGTSKWKIGGNQANEQQVRVLSRTHTHTRTFGWLCGACDVNRATSWDRGATWEAGRVETRAGLGRVAEAGGRVRVIGGIR